MNRNYTIKWVSELKLHDKMSKWANWNYTIKWAMVCCFINSLLEWDSKINFRFTIWHISNIKIFEICIVNQTNRTHFKYWTWSSNDLNRKISDMNWIVSPTSCIASQIQRPVGIFQLNLAFFLRLKNISLNYISWINFWSII